MKIIDLLNKIANGEKIPDKFIFAGQTFKKQGSYIEDEEGDRPNNIKINNMMEQLLINKINEIIDKLNEMENKDE